MSWSWSSRLIIEGRKIGCSQSAPATRLAFPFTFPQETTMPDELIDRHLGEDATVAISLAQMNYLVTHTSAEVAYALGGAGGWEAEYETFRLPLRLALDAWMVSDCPPPQPPVLANFEAVVAEAAIAEGFDGIVDAYHRCGPGILTNEDGSVGVRADQ